MMNKSGKKFRVYFSHCIRGAKGLEATLEDIKANCEEALAHAKKLRIEHLNCEFYVPAEHEDFVNLCYRWGYLTEEQILGVDCGILADCDILYAYNNTVISRGMKVEIKYANDHAIPVVYYDVPAEKPKFEVGDFLYGLTWLDHHNQLIIVRVASVQCDGDYTATAVTPFNNYNIGSLLGSSVREEAWDLLENLKGITL